MFLNELNFKEKQIFLNLASAVIVADGIVKKSEKDLIDSYSKEMQCSADSISLKDLNDQIVYLSKNSSPRIKRIFFMELLSLALVDRICSFEEKEIINKLINTFDFSKEEVNRVIHIQDLYMASYQSIANYIEKGE